ncbi:hypothetical protein [Fundidesulfovibrio magnetotacticus]|uniref:hypothetical protein n=1 Tax=Fundidesulfovibrio magnetotacticus TaxID=2730080 RepID=UPI001566B69A|nr:hypothetical protein [Fundidesulfovibrio magnetotacticus]
MLLPGPLLLLGLWLGPAGTLGTGLERLPSSIERSGPVQYCLEHGFRLLTSREQAFTVLPVFFPARQVQPLQEMHPVTLPLYALARFAGMERERAFQAWFAGLFALNFLCAWLALRREGPGQPALNGAGLDGSTARGASLGGTGPTGAVAACGALLFALAAQTPRALAYPAFLHAFPLPLAFWAFRTWARSGSLGAWAGGCAAAALQWHACPELGAALCLGLAAVGVRRAMARRGRAAWDFFRAERQGAVALAALACMIPLGLNLREAFPGGPPLDSLAASLPWSFATLAACALALPGAHALAALFARRRPGWPSLAALTAGFLLALASLATGPGGARLDHLRALTDEARGAFEVRPPDSSAVALVFAAGTDGAAASAVAETRPDFGPDMAPPASPDGSSSAAGFTSGIAGASAVERTVAAMLAAQDLGLPVVNGLAAAVPPGYAAFSLEPDCRGLARWLARTQSRAEDPLAGKLGVVRIDRKTSPGATGAASLVAPGTGTETRDPCALPAPVRAEARAWLERSAQEGDSADLAWLLELRGFEPYGGGSWRLQGAGGLTLLGGERATLEWTGGPSGVLRVLVDGRFAGRLETGGGPGRASFSPARETRYVFEVEKPGEAVELSRIVFTPAAR